jgi:hypothetical protein
MPNGVHMVGAGGFKKLLKVTSGLPRLTLDVALSNGDEVLIGIIVQLVVVTVITASSYRNSLGSPLRPPQLITFSAPLGALANRLEWRPSTIIVGRLPITMDENGPDHLLTRGVPGGDVKQLLHHLWLIMAELIDEGLAVHVGPECQDDIGIIDLAVLMAF